MSGRTLQEVLDEERHVLPALAERRQPDLDDGQPVVEILAEAARRHLVAEVAVGRGDDAHVHVAHVGAAPAHLALLQDAQELRPGLERELADLVEEDGAGVGHLEEALLARRSRR